MKPDFMAELVVVEGLGGLVNSHENIELLDMQLNRDGFPILLLRRCGKSENLEKEE